jgi:ribonuclease P protein component
MRVNTLRPRERLRKRHQFINVFKTGIRKESRHFTCVLVGNSLPWRRLGLTVGKRTGNAVARNRVKRKLREYFRCNKAYFPDSTDIVISARTGAAQLDYKALNQELSGLLQPETLQKSYKP